MPELRYSKTALKALLKMPNGIAARMRDELAAIAAEPAAYRGDWKPLHGSEFWRLRVGEWRAICQWQDGRLVLLVLKVAARGGVYK